jgi:hypothetical protein
MRQLTNTLILVVVVSTCLLTSSCGNDKKAGSAAGISSLGNAPVKPLPDSVEVDYRNRIQQVGVGDLNGDGKPDTLFVLPPRYTSPSDPLKGCLHDSCYCRIRFSCNLPDLYPVIGTGEMVGNVGDLNGDGYSELAFIPEWPTSVWQSLSVYGYVKGKWMMFGQGSINLQSMDTEDSFFTKRVKRLDAQHFEIISDSLNASTDTLVQTHHTFVIH